MAETKSVKGDIEHARTLKETSGNHCNVSLLLLHPWIKGKKGNGNFFVSPSFPSPLLFVSLNALPL